MKLYSYVVARDYGFAPNPFYGFCTLGTCKPPIRKAASIGDWIIGTGSKRNGREGHLVYAMHVSEAMSFQEYWDDMRFYNKLPSMYASKKKAFGDNIYFKMTPPDSWCQADSHHSYGQDSQNRHNIENDTKMNRVLIGSEFVYWGGDGPQIPNDYVGMLCKSGPGYKCNFTCEFVEQVVNWIRSLGDEGYCGVPFDWRS